MWKQKNAAMLAAMNTHFRPEGTSLTTRAADDLPRRRWTVAEIDAMMQAGVIDEDERFELIDGDVVPMASKGIRHESYKASLLSFWMKAASDAYRLIPETTFRLGDSTFLEPDILFYDGKSKIADLSPRTSLLAVEIADTTLAYDRGRKAMIYARHGVPALWVINVNTLQTHVYADPSPDGYLNMRTLGPGEALTPSFAPELAVKLGELPEF